MTYFPGEGHHRSPILVNPSHVAFVIAADSGSDGQQCWIRLAASGGSAFSKDFLVSGNLTDLADKLNGEAK